MVPAWTLLVVVYILVVGVIGGESVSVHYLNSLLTLGLFLAVLGLGQGAVVLTGGLDLSVPHTLAFTGVVVAGRGLQRNGRAGLLGGADGAGDRCRRRPLQRHRRGALRHAGDRRHAGHQRHHAGCGPALHRRHPHRALAACAGVVLYRAAGRARARRLVPPRLRRCRLCRATPHDLRPARFRGRQQARGWRGSRACVSTGRRSASMC